MNFEVSDLTGFNEISIIEAVANASGISTADVALVVKNITVHASYTFGETIDEANATQAVAAANNVSVSQVLVQIVSSRRLGQGSKSALGRRLASTVKATVNVATFAQAAAVHASSTNNVALQSALASQGVVVSVPTMQVAPKVHAQVVITMTTESSQAGPLSAGQLANVASQIGGTVTVTSVSILTTAGNTTSTSTALFQGAIGGAASKLGKPFFGVFALLACWNLM